MFVEQQKPIVGSITDTCNSVRGIGMSDRLVVQM